MASDEKKEAPRRERSSLAVFLGMVMSALVSLFIAGTMFTVGAIHRRMADDRAIDECTGMGKELDKVLEIAAEEGVDEAALAELGKARAEAAKLTEALVKQKEKLLPDVQLSTNSIDIGRKLGHMVPWIKISNFSNAPVTITRLASTWKELRLVLTHESSKTLIPQEVAPEIKPDEAVVCQVWMSKLNDVLPAGPFEGAITIETDCPGYEKFTVPIKGTVEKE